jgi:predicted DNA binding CopG/RHH family protein
MPNQDKTKQTSTKAETTKPDRHNARKNKTRFIVRMPDQLLENIKAESTRTGRGMTDIVIEQMWYRYPPQ